MATAIALGIYLAYFPYEEGFQYLAFILAILRAPQRSFNLAKTLLEGIDIIVKSQGNIQRDMVWSWGWSWSWVIRSNRQGLSSGIESLSYIGCKVAASIDVKDNWGVLIKKNVEISFPE
ncbi:hypothetical protein Tco_0004396 [Tanacetum coccineum]